MISITETIVQQSQADPVSNPKQFTQDLKSQIIGSVRQELVANRAAALASGNTKEVAKLDAAIAKLDAKIADVPASQTPVVPQPPAPPVIYTSSRNPYRDVIPQQAVDIVQGLCVTLVFCVVGLPIARAIGRWIDRRGTTPPASREVASRLQAIEEAVESVAVEVERISEGQRFTTKLLNERAQEPAREFVVAERDPVASLPANSRRS